MRKLLAVLALGVCAVGFHDVSAQAQTAPEVTLTRMSDCGTSQAPTDVALRFTDTYAYNGVKIQFVFSCYLVKHGDEYAVMRRESARIGLMRATPEWPPGIGRMYAFIRGIEEFAASVEGSISPAGGKLIESLAPRPYGLKDFAVSDPDGNRLAFSEEL